MMFHVYKAFFLCEITGSGRSDGHETDDMEFPPPRTIAVIVAGARGPKPGRANVRPSPEPGGTNRLRLNGWKVWVKSSEWKDRPRIRY